MNAILGSVAIALTLSWLGPSIDDHSAEQAIADDLEQAQQIEQIKLRAYQTAVRRCLASHGHGAVPVEDEAGNIAGCKPRRRS